MDSSISWSCWITDSSSFATLHVAASLACCSFALGLTYGDFTCDVDSVRRAEEFEGLVFPFEDFQVVAFCYFDGPVSTVWTSEKLRSKNKDDRAYLLWRFSHIWAIPLDILLFYLYKRTQISKKRRKTVNLPIFNEVVFQGRVFGVGSIACLWSDLQVVTNGVHLQLEVHLVA